ncbi:MULTISPECIES: TadE/TadG family type IV pilus assembly protein [Rhodomicrobium]|uniref:TadE/TadG family type IV pilus assembly protein n=1 Tax=Rhodomicrobium TaxID=1068 RepID=UPI001FD9269F|nr:MULTISPECIES: TadE/TadG family type IV pilus assembly protein [Rhodomicrobium]
MRTLAGRRGTAAIEYAIIAPVLFVFLLGIMDTSRLLWTYTTLYRATHAAARCGAVNDIDCGTTSAIQNEAVSEAWGLTVAASAFTVTTVACGVRVSIAYTFTFTTPGFSTLAINATACHPT